MSKVSLDECPYVYIHRGGCNGVSFYLRRKLHADDPLTADNVVWPDGKESEGGDPIICFHCKLPLEFLSEDNIERRSIEDMEDDER